MALVPVFNAAGIAPLSLAGQSRWTNMMWLEYLFDRSGGPEVFEASRRASRTPGRNPAAIDRLTKIQDLVRAGGFVNGFQSIAADTNADQALIHTGRAAMMLHGAWTYGVDEGGGRRLRPERQPRLVTVPGDRGRRGRPEQRGRQPGLVPGAVLQGHRGAEGRSRRTTSPTVCSPTPTSTGGSPAGAVPVVNGVDSRFAGARRGVPEVRLRHRPPRRQSCAHSWDQALLPGPADEMLNNIEQLFSLSISPEQFATNMNAVTLVVTSGSDRCSAATGRSSLAGAAGAAVLHGVRDRPAVGVLVLSFTAGTASARSRRPGSTTGCRCSATPASCTRSASRS